MQSQAENNPQGHYSERKLWSMGAIEHAGSLLWETQIKNQDQDNHTRTVQIYDNGVVQMIKSQGKQRSLRHFTFEFQVIVDTNVQELTVQFSKEDEKIKYKLNDFAEVVAWKNILKNKLNQKGFHQKFKPLRKLGKGTFATVFSALKHEDHNIYAIKAFHKQATYCQEFGKQTLKKQLQVMRRLNNKNIMRLYQVYESDNSLYMVFDYLRGSSLQQKFREEYVFTEEETINITRCLLIGLREMHSLNIMHRDLKPDNLMFRIQEFDQNEKKNPNWSNQIVICDLGLAQFCNAQKYLYTRCGTPGYVAPQVINIKDFSIKYSYACDIYSLGLILHVLLTGKTLFPGRNYEEVLKQNRSYEYNISKQGIYSNLSEQAIDLLAKMLIKNPSTRITAKEALEHPYILGQKLPRVGFSFRRIFSFFRKEQQNQDKNKIQRQIDIQSPEKNNNQLKLQKSRKIVYHEQQIQQQAKEQGQCNPQTSRIFKEQDGINQPIQQQQVTQIRKNQNAVRVLANNYQKQTEEGFFDEINPLCYFLGTYF